MTISRAVAALADARPEVFWSDRSDAPGRRPPLRGSTEADLVVVGGGFTGLWAAIQALEDDPDLRVTVVETQRCGFGASSRNGGICNASLTHGLANGVEHWPEEVATLVRMGRENLDGIERTIHDHGIDADYRRGAGIGVATEQWHLDEIEESVSLLERFGIDGAALDAGEMRAIVDSPTYLGGVIVRDEGALVDPARLCWGLRDAAEKLGATVHEGSPVVAIEDDGVRSNVRTELGVLGAARVVVATNAYPAPVKGPRRHVIPVYDHVLMTEPLSDARMASIGWRGREGIDDLSNQFHYYRLTADNRILWGGYDATYHFGNGVSPAHDQRDETHAVLAEHFFETFPQLEGLRFTHRWGGPIGTTTRFTAAWGTAHAGRLVWVAGYTGLGVGASRFGARVALDLVFGRETERTDLAMVRKRPFPFPPEPLRWAGVQLTRRAIQRADRREGRRGPWLRFLDKFGIGFDS